MIIFLSMPKQFHDHYFRMIIENSSLPIMIVDSAGLIQFINPEMESFFGYRYDELIESPVELLIPKKFRKKHAEHRSRYLVNPIARPMGTRQRLIARHHSGRSLAVDIELTPFKTSQGEQFIAVMIHDMQMERALEKKLAIQAHTDRLTGLMNRRCFEEKLLSIKELAIEEQQMFAVCLIDLDNFKGVNDVYGHIYGDLLLKAVAKRLINNTRQADIIARIGGDEFACIITNLKNDNELLRVVCEIQALFKTRFKVRSKLLSVFASIGVSVFPKDDKTGKTLIEKADTAMYQSKSKGYNILSFYTNRFTDKHKSKETGSLRSNKRYLLNQVSYLKDHDILTGLENFTALRRRIDRLLEKADTPALTIFLVGLDNFKLLNNLIGIKAADIILKKTATLIAKHIDATDFLARKTSDEFFIVSSQADLASIMDKAQQILTAIAKPFLFSERLIHLTASIGISRYPEDATDTESLFKHVDIALHFAKQKGKNNYQLFTQVMGDETRYVYHLQTDLPYALSRNEFVVYYQLQMDVSSRRIVGVEALLRWQHPQFGMILPQLFIPIAEQTGEIGAIGAWVLRQACWQASRWYQSGQTFQIAVNVSLNQLVTKQGVANIAFFDLVKMVLEETRLPPHLLVLEITESIFIRIYEPVEKIVKKLKKLGVQIACDDFGSGYASFLRIEQLPLDQVKIDRSLICHVTSNQVQRIIIHNVVTMIKELNMQVIIEGVETESQCNILKNMGCELIQGYLIDVPKPPNELNFNQMC